MAIQDVGHGAPKGEHGVLISLQIRSRAVDEVAGKLVSVTDQVVHPLLPTGTETVHTGRQAMVPDRDRSALDVTHRGSGEVRHHLGQSQPRGLQRLDIDAKPLAHTPTRDRRTSLER